MPQDWKPNQITAGEPQTIRSSPKRLAGRRLLLLWPRRMRCMLPLQLVSLAPYGFDSYSTTKSTRAIPTQEVGPDEFDNLKMLAWQQRRSTQHRPLMAGIHATRGDMHGTQ